MKISKFIDRTNRRTTKLNRDLNISSCIYELANNITLAEINNTVVAKIRPYGSTTKVNVTNDELKFNIFHSKMYIIWSFRRKILIGVSIIARENNISEDLEKEEFIVKNKFCIFETTIQGFI